MKSPTATVGLCMWPIFSAVVLAVVCRYRWDCRTRTRCSRGWPSCPRWRSRTSTSCRPRSSCRRASTRYRRATRSRSACSSAASTTAAGRSSRPSTTPPATSKSSAGYDSLRCDDDLNRLQTAETETETDKSWQTIYDQLNLSHWTNTNKMP